MAENTTKRVVTYDVDGIEQILESFDKELTLTGFKQIDTVMRAVNYLRQGGEISEVPVEASGESEPVEKVEAEVVEKVDAEPV